MQRSTWLPPATFFVFGLGLLAHVLGRPIMHDEEMYIGAGAMLASHDLYAEVAHAQMPYLPWLYDALYGWLGRDLVAVARGVTFVSLLLSMLACYGLIGSLGRRLVDRDRAYVRLCGCVVVVLLCCMQTIARLAPYATNHGPVLAVGLLALWCFASAIDVHKQKIGTVRSLLGGLCLAVVVGIKLTYGLFPVTVLAVLLSSRELPFGVRLTAVWWALLGLAIGTLPCWFALADAGWDLFFFDNLGYHIANAEWRHLTNYPGPLGFGDKLQYAWEQLGQPAAVAAAMVFGFGWWSGRGERAGTRTSEPVPADLRQSEGEPDSDPIGDSQPDAALPDGALPDAALPNGALPNGTQVQTTMRNPADDARAQLAVMRRMLLWALAVGVASAIVPTPSQGNYYALPIACLALAAGVAALGVKPEQRTATRTLLQTACVLAIALGGPRWFRDMPKLLTPSRWTARIVAQDAEHLRAALANAGIAETETVATLAPIVPLQAGLPIPLVASCGPFMYRIGDLVPDHITAARPLLKPSALREYLTQHRGAVLLGFEPDLDPRWQELLEELGYQRVPSQMSQGEIWARP